MFGLSEEGGFNGILVVVEKISKMTKLIVVKESITSRDTAQAIWDRVVCTYGVPLTIVSDRDPRFTSRYWKDFWRKLGVNLAMSSAKHP